MTVLDFGCGPGFLSLEVSKAVARVVAVDVSRGVVACARVINPARNITYLVNASSDLRAVPDGSIDLVFSFAVFQHLEREQTIRFLGEFARILKPAGVGMCQFAINEAAARREGSSVAGGRSYADQYRLRMTHTTLDDVEQLVKTAGFAEVSIVPISTIAQIKDDIGTQHLATFRQRKRDSVTPITLPAGAPGAGK
jgi:ubiquinone/menaquinone biosynthesis C-methylase UbiE